jgi:cobalamin biosynthesis protein CobW
MTTPAPSLSKVPCTIITGFLGAGKTTLIRHLIEHADGRRLALVINEFGDVGVDGAILRACGIESCPEDAIVELANGCLCCTVADDFIPTIDALLARPERPEHIIIETSGLALPKPLIQAFNWPDIATRVTVDGVVAVVDGPAVAAGRFASDVEALAAQAAEDPSLDHDNPLAEVFEDQVLAADMVIINKRDLMTDGDVRSVETLVRGHSLRPVRVITTSEGRVPPAVAIGLNARAEADLVNRPSHHDGEDGHDHEDFESFSIELAEIDEVAPLLERLARTTDIHDLLRVKGHVAQRGKPMRLLIQGVGSRFRHHFDGPFPPSEPRRSRLVVIGRHGLDRAAITRDIVG